MLRGFISAERKPGAKNSKIPNRSSALFSTGVPVSAQLRLREMDRTTSLVELKRFLMRCDSSSTTRSKWTPGGQSSPAPPGAAPVSSLRSRSSNS